MAESTLMIKTKTIIFIVVCLFITVNLNSHYVVNNPIELEQPDGTIVKAFITGTPEGGRHNLRIHNSENYTIVIDSNSHNWCWAKQASDGSLESTGYEVHLHDPKTLNIKPNEDYSDKWRQLRKLEEE